MTGYQEGVNYWADRADAAEKRVAELEAELTAVQKKIEDSSSISGYLFDEGWTEGYKNGYRAGLEDAEHPEREF